MSLSLALGRVYKVVIPQETVGQTGSSIHEQSINLVSVAFVSPSSHRLLVLAVLFHSRTAASPCPSRVTKGWPQGKVCLV